MDPGRGSSEVTRQRATETVLASGGGGEDRRGAMPATVPQLSAAPTAPTLTHVIFSSFAVGPGLSFFCLPFLSLPLRRLPFYLNPTLEATA